MELPNAGSGNGEVAPFHRIDGGEEFRAAQRAGAAESRVAAGADEFRHAAYVVVVPVGRNDHADGAGRVEADAFQVLQSDRRVVGAETGIDDNPCAAAEMQDDAFAVTGPENGDFELVVARWPVGHGANARAVTSAHA